MSNLDLIDDYLSNRLSEQDKNAFERQLDGDPSLKNELEFQRQVVDGVRQARMLEIKTMLNNVPVTTGSTFTGTKIAAAVITAGIIATSLYFYYQPEDSLPQVPKEITTETQKPQPDQTTPSQPAGENEQTEKVIEPAKETSKAKEKSKTTSTKETPTPVQKPDLQVTDPSGEFAETTEPSETTSPGRDEVRASKLEVTTLPADKKHTFHYQFAGGKLILYGPFDKNLYEILEIHGSGHAVFLFYKENYYLLDERETKVTALQAIRDGQLLKKLKEYRSQ